ncbi:hypothetical protein [Photobacterium leiognathi]|uniref:hypothetical protein n=1 Tax=Photobacterium leiognathi TaxID=553611 RepID=UPI0006B68CE1|nr:hypothetical protein [Photobacterium leiognathi]KPA54544.1 hypothetical protein VT25_01235 [Photobacterium leiognathi subsp. mandapamensis]
MKKLVTLSILAALSSPAFAGIQTELAQESNNDTTARVGYVHDSGMSAGLETVFSDGLKNTKEVTVDAAWKFNLSNNVYIQPQAAVTVPVHNRSISGEANDPNSADQANFKVKKGETYKLGVKAGYEADNGLFASARYRYDMADNKVKLSGKIDGDKFDGRLKDRERVHRTDLTLGYNTDVATLSVNWIHKEGKDKASAYSGKNTERLGKMKTKTDEFEFKAVANTFGDLKPYAQYTVKTDTKGTDALGEKFKAKNDNVFKVGLVYNF